MLSSEIIEDIAATAEVCGERSGAPQRCGSHASTCSGFLKPRSALPLRAASKRSKARLRLLTLWPGCRTVGQRLTWHGRRYRGPRRKPLSPRMR